MTCRVNAVTVCRVCVTARCQSEMTCRVNAVTVCRVCVCDSEVSVRDDVSCECSDGVSCVCV